MAQVALKVFSLFCNLGGPFVAPFIIPIVNPALLISSFVPIMLIIMFGTKVSVLNSSDGKKKSWSSGSKWAFLIYYVLALILSCSILQTVCRVGESSGFV